MSDRISAFKCCRTNTKDFHSDTYPHAVGMVIEEPGALDAGAGTCKPGLHVSPTIRQAIRCSYVSNNARSCYPWTFFRVSIAAADVLDRESDKWRVRKYVVEEQITLGQIFGDGFAARVAEVRGEIETWKAIPWLKPSRPISESEIAELLRQWHERIAPWRAKSPYWNNYKDVTLPRHARIVTDLREAHRFAAADAAAADTAAAAAAAAADAADAATTDAADADADADADAAAAADAAADDADAADADAAAAAGFRRLWPHWVRWHVQPRCALWRSARWKIAGMTEPNPWEPLVEMFKLGCAPLGYCRDEDGVVAFTVYVPAVTP